MSQEEIVLRGKRVLTPEGVRPAAIRIRGGLIVSVEPLSSAPVSGAEDVGEVVVMPGVVDPHVHVNEPGRTEWEGFATGTRAAAAGGVTTLFDMPLNSVPPTTSVEGLHAKGESAAGRCRVHVGFWGGAVPENLSKLQALRSAGVFGFKCFLVPSGVPEFGHLDSDQLRDALRETARLAAPLLVHAEDPSLLASGWSGSVRSYDSYLATRPPEAEVKAVELLARLCEEIGARAHVLHVSSAQAAQVIARAQEKGVRISAETCPHYLTFAAEEVPEGATEFKCAPPIRGRENRERLWDALAQGVLELVASDHSPAPLEIKCRESGDFQQAWGGISSLELALPAIWTAARARGFSLEDVVRWMCERPARLTGLAARKGAIAASREADLVLFDPDREWTVNPRRLEQRWKLTPYAGRRLYGVVQATYLKGEKIYERGRFLGPPRGEILFD